MRVAPLSPRCLRLASPPAGKVQMEVNVNLLWPLGFSKISINKHILYSRCRRKHFLGFSANKLCLEQLETEADVMHSGSRSKEGFPTFLLFS